MIKQLAGAITAAILCVPLAAAPSQASPRHPAPHPNPPSGPGAQFRAARLGALVHSAGSAASRTGSGPATIGTLPRVLVGSAPQGEAFDPATRTVYVANAGDNTVSVVSARTCNAVHTSACGRTPATVTVGTNPSGVAIDDATHTVYVTDAFSNKVSVINAATCNAVTTSGCGQTPRTVATGRGPVGIAIDPATDTLYVTNNGSGVNGGGNTVSVIDGGICNAVNTSGCGQTPATVTVGRGPFDAAFDAPSKTVYVTNPFGGSVSMINARTCHAGDTSGCGQKPPTVTFGSSPFPVAVDHRTNTVYVGNNGDGTVSVIDGATCNATTTSGCGHAAINGATCNATITTGCGRTPPRVHLGTSPLAVAVDQATDTIYTLNPPPQHRFRDQRRDLQRHGDYRLRPDAAHRHRRQRQQPGKPGRQPGHRYHLRR